MIFFQDGLSSGHASDLDDDVPHPSVTTISGLKKRNIINTEVLKITENAVSDYRLRHHQDVEQDREKEVLICLICAIGGNRISDDAT